MRSAASASATISARSGPADRNSSGAIRKWRAHNTLMSATDVRELVSSATERMSHNRHPCEHRDRGRPRHPRRHRSLAPRDNRRAGSSMEGISPRSMAPECRSDAQRLGRSNRTSKRSGERSRPAHQGARVRIRRRRLREQASADEREARGPARAASKPAARMFLRIFLERRASAPFRDLVQGRHVVHVVSAKGEARPRELRPVRHFPIRPGCAGNGPGGFVQAQQPSRPRSPSSAHRRDAEVWARTQ